MFRAEEFTQPGVIQKERFDRDWDLTGVALAGVGERELAEEVPGG
jgi:hypothetical protein